MREASDGFFVSMAEISAGFVGLFLIGVFFYAESGFRRSPVRAAFEPYLLASTRIVLVLFAITVGLSLWFAGGNAAAGREDRSGQRETLRGHLNRAEPALRSPSRCAIAGSTLCAGLRGAQARLAV